MNRWAWIAIVVVFLVAATGCTPKGYTTTLVKTKKRYSWYNHNKHGNKRRSKLVKFKSHYPKRLKREPVAEAEN